VLDEPDVAGCDEAGRGPLAGHGIAGLADSKALAPARRERLAGAIQACARWSLVAVGPEEIDGTNILAASLAGMRAALERLEPAPPRAVVDGDRLPGGLPCPAEAWVRGDARHAAVAAASILAKVERDRFMRALALEFPEYGFDRHFGYPTAEHLEALWRHGPCPAHRRTFRPVAEALAQGRLW
jgi:ribonuclease HII